MPLQGPRLKKGRRPRWQPLSEASKVSGDQTGPPSVTEPYFMYGEPGYFCHNCPYMDCSTAKNGWPNPGPVRGADETISARIGQWHEGIRTD